MKMEGHVVEIHPQNQSNGPVEYRATLEVVIKPENNLEERYAREMEAGDGIQIPGIEMCPQETDEEPSEQPELSLK